MLFHAIYYATNPSEPFTYKFGAKYVHQLGENHGFYWVVVLYVALAAIPALLLWWDKSDDKDAEDSS